MHVNHTLLVTYTTAYNGGRAHVWKSSGALLTEVSRRLMNRYIFIKDLLSFIKPLDANCVSRSIRRSLTHHFGDLPV